MEQSDKETQNEKYSIQKYYLKGEQMFRVYNTQADYQLRIRFYKTWPDKELGLPCPPRYTTVCEIQNEDTEEVVFTGHAKIHPNDIPDRIIGKKVALTNALLFCSHGPTVWNFPKYVRTEIWAAFWEWVENWNRK